MERDRDEDGHGAEHRHGRDLGPEIRLAAEIVRHLHRIGRDLGARQHEREQEIVPGEDEGEDGGGEEARARHREDDLPDHLPARAAVDQRAFLELERDVLDVAAHHPDDIGQAEGRVEDDEAVIGVDPAEIDVEQEDREDDGDRRHQALGDDPDGEIFAAGLEAHELVGGDRAEQHGDDGGDAGEDEAVPDGFGIAILEEHAVVGELDRLRLPQAGG